VQRSPVYFDTLRIELAGVPPARIREAALAAGINFRYRSDGGIGIALDETTDVEDVEAIAGVFARANAVAPAPFDTSDAGLAVAYPQALARTSPFLMHPVFNTHRSETGMMRYLRKLERKDIGLDTSMIPLGSCTMKLNAASE